MIYDTFMFFNELDLLEIRLSILDPYVDVFVLGESRETFSGKKKPLYYLENKERFAKWNHKIVQVEMLPKEHSDAFERAYHQKEGLKSALAVLAKDDDTIYYGDLDEIWKPQYISGDKVYSLEQLNYSYFLNNRSSERWVGTIVGKWGTIKGNELRYWRATHSHELTDAGWHFTNMGGPDQVRAKLDSYDHQEFNNEDIRTDIERKIENGEDYVGRVRDWEGKPFEMWIDEVDLPKFLLDNKDRYKHLFK